MARVVGALVRPRTAPPPMAERFVQLRARACSPRCPAASRCRLDAARHRLVTGLLVVPPRHRSPLRRHGRRARRRPLQRDDRSRRTRPGSGRQSGLRGPVGVRVGRGGRRRGARAARARHRAGCASRARTAIVGPVDFSTWYCYRFREGAGDGRDPMLLEPVTPDHSLAQWRSFGFVEDESYFSVEIASPTDAARQIVQPVVSRAASTQGWRVRQLRMRDWDDHDRAAACDGHGGVHAPAVLLADRARRVPRAVRGRPRRASILATCSRRGRRTGVRGIRLRRPRARCRRAGARRARPRHAEAARAARVAALRHDHGQDDLRRQAVPRVRHRDAPAERALPSGDRHRPHRASATC